MLLFSGLLIFCSIVSGQVSLPRIFGDNMVFQRNKPITVWGWAGANEKINIHFHNQQVNTVADSKGNWKINLKPETAGGPFELLVKGKNVITIRNVLVGEVWICSGQSNMEWTVKNSNHSEQEIAAGNYPFIRHFKVPLTVASEPRNDVSGGQWQAASPETVGDFTAVGYFFARQLYNELKIPIGLINTSWGGTHVETWTSRAAFEGSDEFKSMIEGMPRLNLDSLSKQQTLTLIKKIEKLQGSLHAENAAMTWKEVSFKENSWPTMQLPGIWEQQGLDGLDGVVWFRKTVLLDKAQAGKPALLGLSMIDDADECFVNGVKVGNTEGYNVERNYKIPSGVLQAGENLIAVRVKDTGGGGGMYGDSAHMKLVIGDNVYTLAGEWAFQVEAIQQAATSMGPNSYPTLLFNAMINPLLPFGIKGALWYQGESNAGRSYQYRKAFPLMIQDWRRQFAQGDFPFYFVQLASFNAGNGNREKGSTWAELREAQSRTLSLPQTGMAVTTDIGEANDIHPKNKQDVGKRLAAIALHHDYKKSVVYSGPSYQSMRVDGNRIVLSFSEKGSGLIAKDGQLKAFEIAGADQRFIAAEAIIEGDKVVVFNKAIDRPVAVRYAWSDYPEDANLFNREGFPAIPFRTDDWKEITRDNKYVIGQ